MACTFKIATGLSKGFNSGQPVTQLYSKNQIVFRPKKLQRFRCSAKVTQASTTKASLASSSDEPPQGVTGDGESKKESKRLILLRHAMSEKATADTRDHDRTLTPEGREAAAECASGIADIGGGWFPQLILCSDSTRTRETLEQMTSVSAELANAETIFMSSFYSIAAMDGETRPHLQAQVAAKASPSTTCVMCIGHNRGWEEAASEFCGTNVELKSATAALLEVEGSSWEAALEANTWELRCVVNPGRDSRVARDDY